LGRSSLGRGNHGGHPWNAGQKIEDFDLLIGCAAKARGLTMVTHNVKHFEHIEGLTIEDWV
jgi:tRNA(fMet)-specific endonuclease VapC